MRRVRARAPLRLSLAGGGTDLSPYCDDFGGCVLNYTIGLYAYAVIEERSDWKVVLSADDLDLVDQLIPQPTLAITEGLILHRGVYNRMITEFNNGRPLSVNISTAVDAPPGSGLGSSSALVVSLVKAFAEYLHIPLGDYDVARLAFEIERVELGMAGGRQDQYAAAFGGCNFIEFLRNERVIVNPLRIHEMDRLELEASLVVCHTGRSRVSSEIIADQTGRLERGDEYTTNAMHQIKSDAVEMKLCFLRGDVRGMSEVLRRSWEAKKRTSSSISNDRIEKVYEMALANGAIAGKISGAGGGGFLMLMTLPECRQNLIRMLNKNEWQVLTCYLTDRGAEAWCPRV